MCVCGDFSIHLSVWVCACSGPFVPQNRNRFLPPCRRCTSFFFVTPSSFLAPQCFHQFLTSGRCVCLCVCLPSVSPLCPSVSSSCLGASLSTPPLSRGMAAGHAPAAAGTCPSGNTGVVRETITLYSYHSVHSAPSWLNSILTAPEKQMVVLVSEFGQSYASAFSTPSRVCGTLQAYISCRGSSGY